MDPPEYWADLCLEDSTYIPTDFNADEGGSPVFLDDDWLTPDEREFKARALTRQDIVRTTFEPPPTAVTRPTPPTSTTIASTIAPTTSGSVPPTLAPRYGFYGFYYFN